MNILITGAAGFIGFHLCKKLIEKDEFVWDSVSSYDQTPIEWIRVHNLPDHAYFNHAQHVTVGGLECQQCHGNMQEKTVGQVATQEELNKIGIFKAEISFHTDVKANISIKIDKVQSK